MPAAGLSSRYRKAGIELPKPLIPVESNAFGRRPMMEAATFGAPVEWPRFYGVRPEDLRRFQDEPLRNATLIECEDCRCGQSATLLNMASSFTGPDEPCLVYNSDVVHDIDAREFVMRSRANGAKVAVSVFDSSDPSCSYVNGQRFTRAVEKNVISDMAISGLYFFASTTALRSALQEQVQLNYSRNGEYYLSAALCELPAPRIALRYAADRIHDLGTPEKLAASEWVTPSVPISFLQTGL